MEKAHNTFLWHQYPHLVVVYRPYQNDGLRTCNCVLYEEYDLLTCMWNS